MIFIREANENDIESVCSFNKIAQLEEERRQFTRNSVASNTCYVAVKDEKVNGYGVLNYTFYYNGCIDMLYIHAEYWRSGAGTSLLRHNVSSG